MSRHCRRRRSNRNCSIAAARFSTKRLRDSLDQFKLQLGVPTDLPLELDDGPMRALSRHLQKLRDVYEEDRPCSAKPGRLANADLTAVRGEFRKRLIGLPIVLGTPFARSVLERWSVWEKLSGELLDARIQQIGAVRRGLVDQQSILQSNGKDLTPADQSRLDDLTFDLDLGVFEASLRDYLTKRWEREYLDLPESEAASRGRNDRRSNYSGRCSTCLFVFWRRCAINGSNRFA